MGIKTEETRFEPMKSMAGFLEPGDATRYEMVVVERRDHYEVVVLNDGFFDKIIILKNVSITFYHSFRGPEGTNPWTIRAAKIMVELYKLTKTR